MRRVLFCCSILVFLTWVPATSRLLSPGVDDSPRFHVEEDLVKEMKRIGSTPPNCESKCYGCSPCVAIQVPTIDGHFRLQYSNYLPEGWKCKCGPSLYTP